LLTDDAILFWLDCEMTGLDPDRNVLVQLAYIITDASLNEIAAPREYNIWQPASELEKMGPFVRNMHEKSGLLDKVRTSTMSVADVEHETLEVLSRHAPYRTARLCGNSVWQDRRFLARQMPQLEGYLHYRQIDVSTLKELAGWWYEAKFVKPDLGKHTALHDVRQSIAELEFYRRNILRQGKEPVR
jgi:oligoribonuclease